MNPEDPRMSTAADDRTQPKKRACPTCRGAGFLKDERLPYAVPCSTCEAKGWMSKPEFRKALGRAENLYHELQATLRSWIP